MCLGDLDIQPAFISSILGACEGKGPLFPKDRNNSAVLFHFQRCWDTVKTKYLCSVKGIKVYRLTEWLNDTLVLFCEHELANVNVASLNQILEIVRLLYQKDMLPNCSYPIQPLLYFTNFALNQNSLPFERILGCLLAVLKAFIKHNEDSDLVDDIIGKIVAKISLDSLNLKELAVLVEVLKLCRRADHSWLERFLESVPHSTHDETFIVLDIVNCSPRWKTAHELAAVAGIPIRLAVSTVFAASAPCTSAAVQGGEGATELPSYGREGV
ncbi:unnamed protein product [Sphagnum balticum]